MKRIWQYSTSLFFSALLAHQAFGQGYGPRSWKHYLPQSSAQPVAASTQAPAKAAAEEEEAEEVAPAPPAKRSLFGNVFAPRPLRPTMPANNAEPTPADPATEPQAAKAASKVPATDDESSQNTTASFNKTAGLNASYYDQAEESETPPPAPGLLSQGPPTPSVDNDSSSDTSPFVNEPVKPLGNQNANSCTNSVGCANGKPCGDPLCNGCDPCGSGYGDCCDSAVARNFARIEYLMWWGRGRSLPPLVTSSFAGTPQPQAGVLGEPNTTIQYGGNDVGNDWRSGLRLTVGRVLDQNGEWMVVGRLLGLNDSSDEYHATSAAGDPILARPFFNVLLAQEDALLVGYPGVSENGSIDILSKSDMMGAEVYLRHLILGEEDMTIDILGGYQMSRIDDSLDIRNSSLVLVDPQGIFAPNTTIAMRDLFGTRNEFHGGVFGLAIDSYRGPWKLEALGKVGIGNQRQTVTIAGNTLITPAMGPTVNDPNGLLARQTNNGVYQRDVFTFVPELNLTLGYQVNNWTFSVGYSFIYWNDVAFAGSQIDRSVNLSNPIVGDPRPAFTFNDTDFWLQGISFGAEVAF